MNVLWITNIMPQPICDYLHLKTPIGGGWIYSSALQISSISDVVLSIATVYNGSQLLDVTIGKIRYFLLPISRKNRNKYPKELKQYWTIIKKKFNPDIVHIHGTEFPYGLAYLKACGNDKVVISVQGLVSVIARYYNGGLSRNTILRNVTFRDFIMRDNILQQKNKFYKKGKLEKEYISSVKHVIGRTLWDKANVLVINPNIKYHHCNETLRPEFYKNYWCYEKCQKYSIFTSQAGYPLKGLHKLLEAVSIIKKTFPNVKLYIAGNNIIDKPWYRISGYAKILKKMIKKLDIEGQVYFTGPLDEKAICEQYLKSNVFVCPSSIENSSNSVCEAQILGVPYLASYVGGTPDLVYDNSDALYRFEDVEVLAYKIIDIFLHPKVGYNNVKIRERHDPIVNANKLLSIYNDLLL